MVSRFSNVAMATKEKMKLLHALELTRAALHPIIEAKCPLQMELCITIR